MNNIKVYKGLFDVPEIGLGCMRIAEMSHRDVDQLVKTALELGINYFDHADVYGAGKSEIVFAEAIGMNATLREQMLIQSKVGIRKGSFDFSKDHIIKATEDVLTRLKTDYLDALLLHRPDTLIEPEEVAEAFDYLQQSGKVKYFGVSNQNPMQIELLKRYVKQPLIFNQLQLSIMSTGMIDAGINVNMKVSRSIDHDGSILDYSRLNDMTIQAWSPFQYGFFEGVFLNNDKFPELNLVIDKIAAVYNVTNTAIAVAWISRHPAKIQTIVGTTNASRLREISTASDVRLTREEWYEIYRAAGNELP